METEAGDGGGSEGGKRYSGKPDGGAGTPKTIKLKNAICIADSKDVNSVLIYTRPKSKEPNPLCYMKAGGLKMLFKLGLRNS
ncbi:MAG: hypothetical protein J6R17_03870 [Bacteroidales bacterium]|nr:hypothetical protein [Bacteroidales bacterium]